MDRVINSVKQITDECNRMIAIANDCEFADVKSLSKTLDEKLAELNKLYDESPELEREISMKKADVEAVAIRLEFYLDVRTGNYTERRKLRNLADHMYVHLKEAVEAQTSGSDKDRVEYIATFSIVEWALKFLSRSQHIIFEKTDEDETMIMRATKFLEESKNKKGA